ncbi:hypothetical protein FHT86_003302 [Rhizobium sp. BK313]|jgi:hypothetical protein|uniref:hypothetical protein n=1 Tax=Rhizobium sp. BK313 TaxID=2587081 RepID=UPI00105C03F3|nr:hypothetical protein [Rhizobium sp. BK313]MBB3455003.1 hypothetical protein [Rhizobium sp. BK313]
MSESIWIHYSRPRPHWYRLTAEQQAEKKAGWALVEKASIDAGATRVGSYHVRGQHDFQTVDIWQFASPEAAFDHWARLTSAGYNELFAFSNNVGIALEEGHS